MNKIKTWFFQFMKGRYGTDRLNSVILWSGVIMVILALFVSAPVVVFLLHTGAYGMMAWAIFRAFSRNTYKRFRENQMLTALLEQLKDREHRYFICPNCRQPVRVPRGKGKISITCPQCREKFIKKS